MKIPLTILILLLLPGLASAITWEGVQWTFVDNQHTAPSCAWLDGQNNLHMRLQQIDGSYQGALFESSETYQYGTFSWTVKSSSLNLERGSSLGFFTYNDDGKLPLNEIDIEINQWQGYNERAWFVLQPGAISTPDEDKVHYTVSNPSDEEDLTYTIQWFPEQVHWSIVNSRGTVVSEWTYSNADAIQDDAARVCFDLLVLNHGAGPVSGDPVEVVLSDFSYTPYSELKTEETEPVQNGNYISVGNCDGHSDQTQINTAIKNAEPGDTVCLDGIYIIDGTIWMYPGITLSGTPGTVVQVDSTSSWWFREGVPVIGCKGNPKDIEISGFTLDGNCGAFSSSWANDGAEKAHNCEKLIIFAGSSNNFGTNIKIHDMTFINAFSDGAYLRYVDNVQFYNNVVINCQHEGLYLSVCRYFIISGNHVDGITSDSLRAENCQEGMIEYNKCHSYGGESNGAYLHGENGIQIGDAGSSHGYNAVKIGYPTKNITVRYNVFSDPGLKAIWLHEGTENVYIYDNDFIDADELTTDGTPVDITSNGEPISYDNPPTQEQSEGVFDSIFDYMGLTSEYSYVTDTSYNSYYEGKLHTNTNDVDCVFETHVTMDGNYTLIKIDTTDISSITYTINGSVSKHIVKIGVRQGMNVIYSDSSIWIGNAEHDIYGNIFLNNTIDIENVLVQCTTPSGAVNVNRVHTVVNDGGTSINEKLLICLFVVLLPALCGVILLRKLIRTIVK